MDCWKQEKTIALVGLFITCMIREKRKTCSAVDSHILRIIHASHGGILSAEISNW